MLGRERWAATNKKGLKEEQISYIVNESLKGLAYMHAKGIIHRDMKAANILLNSNGEVKLGADTWPALPCLRPALVLLRA